MTRLLALWVLAGGVVSVVENVAQFMVGGTPHWLWCTFSAVAMIGGLYMVGNPDAEPIPSARGQEEGIK